MRVLVVKSMFKDYKVGQIISDEKAMADVWNSEQRVHVIAADHAEIEKPAQPEKVIDKASAEAE